MTTITIPVPLDPAWDAAAFLTAHGGYTLNAFSAGQACWELDLDEALTAEQQQTLIRELDMERSLMDGTATAAAVEVRSYTVAGVPAATAGGLILVTDETGGSVLAFADGTNWRRVTDRAIVSA